VVWKEDLTLGEILTRIARCHRLNTSLYAFILGDDRLPLSTELRNLVDINQIDLHRKPTTWDRLSRRTVELPNADM